jgi:hypothetical protein
VIARRGIVAGEWVILKHPSPVGVHSVSQPSPHLRPQFTSSARTNTSDCRLIHFNRDTSGDYTSRDLTAARTTKYTAVAQASGKKEYYEKVRTITRFAS